MDENQDNAVEKDENAAAHQEVETTDSNASENQGEDNLLLKYEELEKEKARIETERDNYRRGLLKAKGKISSEEDEGGSNEVDLETIVERKIEEKLLANKEYQIQKEKEEILKKALVENKELKLALKTKSKISSSPASSGGNQDHAKSEANFFSEAQLASLKEREQKTGVKIDLKKLEENMRRQMSK